MDRRTRVLVVEDDAELRDLLDAALSDRFDVSTARNVSEAVRLTESVDPDVVLLDMLLPDGSGTDVLALAADGRRRGVVYQTGLVDTAQTTLPDRILRKPFDLRELELAIEQAAA